MTKRLEVIDRGIFLAPSGYWWAWSLTTKDRANSLHTKDKALAQSRYDRQLRELRAYVKQSEKCP